MGALLPFGKMPMQEAAKGNAFRQDCFGCSISGCFWAGGSAGGSLRRGQLLLQPPENSIVVTDQGRAVGKTIGNQTGKQAGLRSASADAVCQNRIVPGDMAVRNRHTGLLHGFHKGKIPFLGSTVIGLEEGADAHMALGQQLLNQHAAAVIIIIADTGNLRKFRAGGKQEHDMAAFFYQKMVQVPVGVGKGVFHRLDKEASGRLLQEGGEKFPLGFKAVAAGFAEKGKAAFGQGKREGLAKPGGEKFRLLMENQQDLVFGRVPQLSG